MACVTLKRPLEWVDPSMSPEHGSHLGSSGPSSPTSMIVSNSPPHSSFSSSSSYPYGSSSALPTKRPCLGSGVHAFSPSSSGTSNSLATSSNFKPLKGGDLAEQIREEMLRLKMIRNRFSSQLLSQTSANVDSNKSSSSSSKTIVEEESSSDLDLPKSTPATSSSLKSSTTPSSSPNTSSTSKRPRTNSVTSSASASKALFTFEQVVMIVDRLLAEKEDAIRREYESALTSRLAEQYEQFVKFSFDQIQRRFDSNSLPSYLS